jgi:putative oxidoreductase
MNKKYNSALLALRIAAGIIFIAHGWQKISAPDAFVGFFTSLGFPAFTVYLVGYLEFLGGIAVLLGLFTGIAAAVLAVIIAVALFYVKGGAVFRTFNVPVFEIDLALLAITVALALKGSGAYAVKPSHGLCCGCKDGGVCDVK